MDCLEFRKNLLLHVGRELPEEVEKQIRLHLESCPCCQRRARYEERFQSWLQERLAPPPLPPGLRDRICRRLATETESAPSPSDDPGKPTGEPPEDGSPPAPGRVRPREESSGD